MGLFILTWNPDLWQMTDGEYQQVVNACRLGSGRSDTWSTGGRTSGIGFGDRAVLLRQHRDRGIIASGYFTTEVFQDQHWREPDRSGNFADLVWETWVPIEDRLPVEVLKAKVPGVVWDRLQGSGVRPSDSDAAALAGLWEDHLGHLGLGLDRSADEVTGAATFPEGAVTPALVNRYERSREARQRAIAVHGLDCVVCGFNYGRTYGELGEGFVHVHHLRELSTLPPDYAVDPNEDLVPVCANCHAMLHRRTPALHPDDLRQRLRDARQ